MALLFIILTFSPLFRLFICSIYLELATVGNDNFAGCFSTARAVRLNFLDNFQALNDPSEDDVLAIQPGGRDRANEELGPVGVGPCIGHGKDTGALVTETEVFIGKLFTVDGTATGAVVAGEITTLAHEFRNDTVETGILERQALPLFTSAQGAEVFSSAGDNVGAQFHDNAAKSGTIGDHIEEDTRIGRHL